MHVIYKRSAGSRAGSGRSWAKVWSREKSSLSLVPWGALEHFLQHRSGPWAGLMQSCIGQPLATGLREGGLRSPAGISGQAAQGKPPGQGAGVSPPQPPSAAPGVWAHPPGERHLPAAPKMSALLLLSSAGVAAWSLVLRKMVRLEGGSVVT